MNLSLIQDNLSGVFSISLAFAIDCWRHHSYCHLAFYRVAALSILIGKQKAPILTQLEDESIMLPRGANTIRLILFSPRI